MDRFDDFLEGEVEEEELSEADEVVDSLEEARTSHRRYIDRRIEAFEEFASEHVEALERLKSAHQEFMSQNIEDIRGRYEAIKGRVGDIEDLKMKYDKLLDEHIDLLDEYGENRRGDSIRNLVAGALLGGTGLLAAETYSYLGVFGFYANTPEIYADDPEMAILTLGFPAAGVYLAKKSYDAYSDYRDLEERERELKARRRQEFDDWD